MNLHELLKEKLENEMSEFRGSYNNMSVTQAYNDWYVIGFKEEYFEMLMSDFVRNRFDDKELAWLGSLEKPLDFLYDEWCSCDGAMNHDWDTMLDFVHGVYYDEQRREKNDLYHSLQTLDIKAVEKASDDYFDEFDFRTHVSPTPVVLSHTLPKLFDEEINKQFAAFFKDNFLVKSCDYGCDTYPCGVSKAVALGNVQTYQQQVWNFIEDVEQTFNCKCNYYNEVNGFEFVFELGEENNKGCYVFCAGNNGQEFSQALYLQNPEQIHDENFVKSLTTIDKAFHWLLEDNDLSLKSREKATSLDEQIKSADGVRTVQQNKDFNITRDDMEL